MFTVYYPVSYPKEGWVAIQVYTKLISTDYNKYTRVIQHTKAKQQIVSAYVRPNGFKEFTTVGETLARYYP